MKYEITVRTDDEFERDAIMQAVGNKLKLEGLYDEVFRRVIKYGQDEKEIEAYEMVWKKVTEYLEE